MADTQSPRTVPRAKAHLVEMDKSFELNVNTKDNISHQYFELYNLRLQRLRPCLQSLIRSKWGDIPYCERLLDCQTSDYEEVAIIGTCFKDQKKKSNPLEATDDADNDDHKSLEGTISKLIGINCSGSDFLMLEDEIGSLKLSGPSLNKHRLLTGITLAVRGSINKSNGVFIATDHLLCGLPPLSPSTRSLSEGEDKYIALVSGLEISKMADRAHSMSIEMMFNYLGGFLGDGAGDGIASKICRVMFVGNVLCEELPNEDGNIFYDTKFKKKEQAKIASLDGRLKELDLWMSQLAASVAVDVMPGAHDPSDELLPQQPFHQCLFPMASSFSTFHRVTNPYCLKVDGRSLLGTAGQNFVDMIKHSRMSMIEAMELSLRSRIIAPTAPDTLSCFPFRVKDPFVIEQCPDVYFSGNNEQFGFKQIGHEMNGQIKTCLLEIPSFVRTKQIVLLNLRTMQPQVMQFGIE